MPILKKARKSNCTKIKQFSKVLDTKITNEFEQIGFQSLSSI